MAETQTVIIEFLTDDVQLDTAINKLEKTGAVDTKLAQDFKKNTAEISKQAIEIQKTAAAASPLKKSMEDVARAVKTTTSAFVTGFHEGVEGALKDAGVSISELKQKLGLFNKDSPFDKLSNSLSQARDRVLNISAAMSQLQRTGGVDTEQFERLGKLLVQRQAEFDRLQTEYDNVTAAIERNNEVTDENTEKIDANAAAQEDLKKKLGELKQKLESTTKDAAFDKLSKSVNEARSRVLNITAAMVQLKKTGGVDTEQFKRLQSSLSQAKTELTKLQSEYDEVTGSVDRNSESTDENANAQQKLKQRLAEIAAQLVILKSRGEDNTEQYRQLVAEAGSIKDAIGDVNQEIKNSAANSKVLDGVIGAAQGVAAGFAIAEGTAGLFGSQNKELNAVMVRVTSTMAILQGAQQVGNLLQKESAAIQLITNARLAIENGLQSQSVIVRFAAAAAQKVLNAAMSVNPIGILVVAIAGLIAILATYGKSAAKAREQTTNLNVALTSGIKAFEEQSESIKRTGENAVNELENQGAAESKIAARRLETEKQLAEKQKTIIDDLTKSKANNQEADLEKRKEIDDKIRELQDKQEADEARLRDLAVKQQKILNEERLKNTIAGLEAELSAAAEGSKNQLNLQRRLISARTSLELNADGLLENERKAIAAKSNQERLEAEAAFNKRRIDLQLQVIEAQLVNVREGSQEELDLKKKQLNLQAQSEITSTKLSEKEKQAIVGKGFQDRLKLQREYNERVRRESIEAQISVNEAQIAQIKTNDDDRLILQIANIELAAAAEVDAAKGNSAKIKEINAKRDADILAVRKKFIDDAAQYEIDIRTADNGPSNRALQRTIADEKKGLEVRKTAIKQLAEFQIANINTQLAALEEEKEKKLISEKDYILKYKQLQDKKKEITEESEKATTDLIKAETVKRIQAAISVATQVADVYQAISDTQTQKDQDRISAEKERTAELLAAGAITEREAAARSKRIEAEEKKAKLQQAQREKNIAIFRALIAIPQAVLQGLAQGGPILAAIYGALAAAQAIIIASRPLPRFGHGKKSGYEGPAEIGETGAELYEQNGRMFLADKKQIVWLGAKDKVYNPTETKEMLMPVVDKQLMQWQAPTAKQPDMKQMAAELAKEIKKMPGTNVSIDEYGLKVWVQEGLSRKNYMDKRYSSK